MNVILRRASLNLTPRDKQRLTCAFCWRASPLKALVTGCCMKNMAMPCESHRGHGDLRLFDFPSIESCIQLNLGAGLGLWCLWCWPPRLRAARTLWTRPFLQIRSPKQPENSFRTSEIFRAKCAIFCPVCKPIQGALLYNSIAKMLGFGCASRRPLSITFSYCNFLSSCPFWCWWLINFGMLNLASLPSRLCVCVGGSTHGHFSMKVKVRKGSRLPTPENPTQAGFRLSHDLI